MLSACGRSAIRTSALEGLLALQAPLQPAPAPGLCFILVLCLSGLYTGDQKGTQWRKATQSLELRKPSEEEKEEEEKED